MKFRHEVKISINAQDALLLRQRLTRLMQPDENTDADGRYLIKSLYFDNFSDKVLREKQDGLSVREKFRIRYYNDDPSFIRLEKKSKIHGLCLKESRPVTADGVRRLLDGDFVWLREAGELGAELYAKMHCQQLRPKNVVIYTREAYVYPPGNVRVTLDSDIRGSADPHSFLTPDAPTTRLWNLTVLEVKWDEYLPGLIRDAVQLDGRSASAFSKYAAVRFI